MYKGIILVLIGIFYLSGISLAQNNPPTDEEMDAMVQNSGGYTNEGTVTTPGVESLGDQDSPTVDISSPGGTPTASQTSPTQSGSGNVDDYPEYKGETGLVKCSGKDCDFAKFFETVTDILKYIYIMAFSIATILFAYAGVLFMTSQGDTTKVDRAKGIFRNVIIGLVIMALSYWAVWFLLSQLGIDKSFYIFLTD